MKFSKNAVWVLGSCYTANSVNGSETLANYAAEQLNITTVGATSSVYPEVVNGKETGRLSTDGTFKMFTPYQVNVKKQIKETTTLFGIPIWTSTKTVNTTETRTKETNLGSTVNPSKLVK